MEAVGDVTAAPAELTAQSESIVFAEFMIVLNSEIADAAAGGSSCSEIQNR